MLRTYGILLMLVLVAYWPLASFTFALKNDAFTGYFPVKYFISQCLKSGMIPLWNPYLNYGFPQYADMSSAFWSPITWFIAATSGYNVYSYTLEELFYLFLAGLGMHRLCLKWPMQNKVALLAGLSYMCCGFMVGHLQHFNWISGAAFLPWCLHTYLLCQKKISFTHLVLCAFSFYLLISSAHPGLLISAFYFFIFIALSVLIWQVQDGPRLNKRLKQFLQLNGSLFLLITLLCIPLLVSYVEIAPLMDRGSILNVNQSQQEPSTLQSWISIILPWSTTKNEALFQTDIAMRNSYMGLWVLLFAIAGWRSSMKDLRAAILLVIALFFFLLSLGGIFKVAAYYALPMMGYVRLNGEFRILSLLCLILVAAISLNNYLSAPKQKMEKLSLVMQWLRFFLWVTAIAGLAGIIITRQSLAFQHQGAAIGISWISQIKRALDGLSFYDTLFLQSVFQLFILQFLSACLRKNNVKRMFVIFALDLLLASILNIPFTGVGQTSPARLQALIDQAPKGIPMPKLQPTILNDTINPDLQKLIGSWAYYNKEIGSVARMGYPVNLRSAEKFYAFEGKKSLDENPFLFFENKFKSQDTAHITLQRFSATAIDLICDLPDSNYLVYKQNAYPFWVCRVDGKETPAESFKGIFIKCRLVPGRHSLSFIFQHPYFPALLVVQAILWLAGILFFLWRILLSAKTAS